MSGNHDVAFGLVLIVVLCAWWIAAGLGRAASREFPSPPVVDEGVESLSKDAA